jgi:hypothetical protein
MDDETKTEDKTEDTPPISPTPPTPPHDNSLSDAVARLEGVVAGLALRVEQIVSHPQDERPISKPWTHKRF